MSLGVKHHLLDFEILETKNPRTLVFLDSSQYYKEPESPLLEVTLPGYTKYFLLNVSARKINTFNSNTIGLTETLNTFDLADLPDGVWKLKFKVCPYEEVYIQKYHLRTVDLENRLAKIYEYLDLSDCDIERDIKLKNNIIDIILAIESGKSNAALGNVKKASTLYQKASSLVNKTLNKLTQTC